MSKNTSNKKENLLQLQKTLKLVDYLSETLNDFLLEQTDTMTQIGELNKQLKALEAKRNDLKDQIEAAKAFKEKMENVVHGLRCSLSPMRDLPAEILLQVFKMAIEEVPQGSDMHRGLRRASAESSLAISRPGMRPLAPDILREFIAMEILGIPCMSGLPNQQSFFIPSWGRDSQRLIRTELGIQSTPYKELEIKVSFDPDGMVWDIQALSAHETTLYCSPQVSTITFFLPLLQFSSRVTVYGTVPTWGGQLWALLRELSIVNYTGRHSKQIIRRFGRVELTQLLDAAPFLENLQLRFTVDEANLAWDDTVNMSHDHIKSLSIHLHHFVGGKGLLGFHHLKRRSIHMPLDDSYKVILPKLAIHRVQLAAELLRWLPSVKRLEVEGGNMDQLVTFTRAAYHQLPPLITPLPSPALTTLHVENTDIQGETLLGFVRVKLQHRMAGTEGVCAVECIEMYDTPGVGVADWERIQGLLGEGVAANSTRSSAE